MRILTFGAFDLLHYGHMRLLQRAALRGTCLVVGLADDELITKSGKPEPFYPFDIRREMLLHTRHVDEVIRHGGPIDGSGRVKVIAEKIRLIEDKSIDQIVMGSDWKGEYDFLEKYCDVIYLGRTPGISTTIIRDSLQLLYRYSLSRILISVCRATDGDTLHPGARMKPRLPPASMASAMDFRMLA